MEYSQENMNTCKSTLKNFNTPQGRKALRESLRKESPKKGSKRVKMRDTLEAEVEKTPLQR